MEFPVILGVQGICVIGRTRMVHVCESGGFFLHSLVLEVAGV